MEENIISKWLFKYGNEIIRKKTEEKLERLMKQETIEEAMNQNGYHDPKKDKLWREGVQFGAKWQQERMYSEEEVLDVLIEFYKTFDPIKNPPQTNTIPLWFEQFKKK